MTCIGPGATHHLACECREREVERMRERLAACERVVEAARALRDSGYDGPMMGDEVAPLFSALAALDGNEAE